MADDAAPALVRAQVLREAEKLICGDRNAQYGDPLQDFKRIATMWSLIFGIEVLPHQVAMCMMAMKLSRLVHSPGKYDSWVDAAGYAGCGWECAQEEEKGD